ncbi:hypothetical protein DYBT9275_02817 [Dyadobacter sp. CECT 9275]|uniref:Uncharacterized protein n=1 Tax=Dyadobacter helix TaxID=2822344 RepID=A0A916JCF7_9BACT|nr:hypothetical protein [Dyadobacter sp. CECT 9275]CAG5002136.1 hypothetical protein DYBT9275_02817 [Dyadobacter sp. CECT 9275]
MAESTNDPELTNKGHRAPEKNTDRPKNNLAGIGAPAAGAATGAAVAAGIKFSDDIIEALAGNPEADAVPDQDPNEPENAPEANTNTVTTPATPIAHTPNETVPQGEPDSDQNGNAIIDQTGGIGSQEHNETVDAIEVGGEAQGDVTDGRDSGTDEIIEAVDTDENYPDLFFVDTDEDGSFDVVEMDIDHDGVIDALYVDDEYTAEEELSDEAEYQDEPTQDDTEDAYENDDTYEDYDSDETLDLNSIL